MTAPASALAAPAARPGSLPLYRLLGALGILGAPAFPLIGALHPGGFQEHDPLAVPAAADNALMFAYIAGWLCSAVGLRRLRAAGRGRGAAVVTAVQLTALALAATQNLQDLAGRRPLGGAFYFATDMAWPFSHVFMLVVFAAVWRAGVWTGWRRWTPLLGGLVLPLTFLGGGTGWFSPNLVFPYGTTLAFAALGLAVATAPDTTRRAD